MSEQSESSSEHEAAILQYDGPETLLGFMERLEGGRDVE